MTQVTKDIINCLKTLGEDDLNFINNAIFDEKQKREARRVSEAYDNFKTALEELAAVDPYFIMFDVSDFNPENYSEEITAKELYETMFHA